MSIIPAESCTAFVGTRRLARGARLDVALAVKAAEAHDERPIVVFDDATGRVIDFDLRGSAADVAARLDAAAGLDVAAGSGRPEPSAAGETEARGRGRPRLGVVAREVTLLPRHWDWLASQPGGASQALRRLVDQARRADQGVTAVKAVRERTYGFMRVLAGDLAGYEEAIRALFAGDEAGLAARMADWPADIRDHVLALLETGAASDEAAP